MGVFKYGIDVSHWQGQIDWNKVKANKDPKIDFVYIKLSQENQSGVNFVDAAALRNATGAKNVGLDFGFYHYATLDDKNVINDATLEAVWFAEQMKKLPRAKLIPTLDIEENTAKLTRADVKLWIDTFFKVMKANGFPKIMLYSYGAFLNDNLPANHGFNLTPLWVANWTNTSIPKLPFGFLNYNVWQYTDKGKVDGIDGVVDMDRSLNVPLIFNSSLVFMLVAVMIAVIYLVSQY